MLFKIILVVLVIAMVVSLSGALNALFHKKSDRTFHWLSIRVAIAVAIFLTLAIGFYTGNLTIGAPWTGRF